MTVLLLDPFPPLTRVSAVPGTFTIRANIPLTGTPEVCALDADTASPDATTAWVPATWDAPQTTEPPLTDGTVWYARSFTVIIAGDQAPARADQLTLGPGEWSPWARISDPPSILILRFDVVSVLP
jgi:hypothetical protein